MLEVEPLDKTELWIEGVVLDRADLRSLAATVAETLGLPGEQVFVTDVRDGRVVLDVLQPRIDLELVVGRQEAVLAGLAALDGVTVRPDAAVHSRGVLGAIGLPRSDAEAVLTELRRLDAGVRGYVARRVAVVSTGAEVLGGEVSDSNARLLVHQLGDAGYEVTATGAVADDEDAILGRVLRLVSEGFGVVVTTGGVGAEDKDRTIEALERADPSLAPAVLATYEPGHGRHVKPHVRVAVGTIEHARLIALPGPTREVGAALPVVLEGLTAGWGNERFAEELAAVLRDTLRPDP